MPTSSSKNLGTEQESKTELSMTSRRAKPAKAKPTNETPPKEATVETVEPAEAEAVKTEATVQSVDADIHFDMGINELIETGRERIDAIDDQLLELIVRRMEVAGTLLDAKHMRQINGRDKRRQEAILNRLNSNVVDLTDNNGVKLNQHQIRELFELLIRLGVESFRQNIINRR